MVWTVSAVCYTNCALLHFRAIHVENILGGRRLYASETDTAVSTISTAKEGEIEESRVALQSKYANSMKNRAGLVSYCCDVGHGACLRAETFAVSADAIVVPVDLLSSARHKISGDHGLYRLTKTCVWLSLLNVTGNGA